MGLERHSELTVNGINKEKLAGLLLMASAAVALFLANSPAAEAYQHFLHLHIGPSLPGLGVPTVHEWIADGLMAIIFLLVGLEARAESVVRVSAAT